MPSEWLIGALKWLAGRGRLGKGLWSRQAKRKALERCQSRQVSSRGEGGRSGRLVGLFVSEFRLGLKITLVNRASRK